MNFCHIYRRNGLLKFIADINYGTKVMTYNLKFRHIFY